MGCLEVGYRRIKLLQIFIEELICIEIDLANLMYILKSCLVKSMFRRHAILERKINTEMF